MFAIKTLLLKNKEVVLKGIPSSKRFLSLFLGLAFLATGCRSAKPCVELVQPVQAPSPVSEAPKNPPIETPVLPVTPVIDLPTKAPAVALAEEVMAKLKSTQPSFTRFEVSSGMNIEMPELDQNVTGHSKMDLNLGLYTSYRATGLNIEAARSLVRNDSFFVYNRIEKELILGPIRAADRFMPISGDLKQVFAILTGAMLPDESQIWYATATDTQYLLRNKENTIRYVVDRGLMRVVGFEVLDDAGQVSENIQFSEPDDFEGYQIPRRIQIEQPAKQRKVAIYHQRFNLNPDELTFNLNVDRSRVKLRPIQ